MIDYNLLTKNWTDNIRLDLGYFANVIKVGYNKGIAITTDGVGSKSISNRETEYYSGLGWDCVAVNYNDLLCVGATPISMVNYIAVEKKEDNKINAIFRGMYEAAEHANITIVGGETAILPDNIKDIDVAGTAIGTVKLNRIIDGSKVEPRDVVIGIESSGIHNNGLTIARKILPPEDRAYKLSATTFIYREIVELFDKVNIKAAIHITEEGFKNLYRIKNNNVGFILDNLPKQPQIFKEIQELGGFLDEEMYSNFNMGVGFCLIVDKKHIDCILTHFKHYSNKKVYVIGKVTNDVDRTLLLKKPSERTFCLTPGEKSDIIHS